MKKNYFENGREKNLHPTSGLAQWRVYIVGKFLRDSKLRGS